LFIKHFKKNPILDEQQWQEAFLYIHLNPVKHGFTKRPEEWRWSSWHGYQHMDRPSNLDRRYYLNFFDGPMHIQEMIAAKREWILKKEYEEGSGPSRLSKPARSFG
jgi:hypothetical protein